MTPENKQEAIERLEDLLAKEHSIVRTMSENNENYWTSVRRIRTLNVSYVRLTGYNYNPNYREEE